MLKRFGLTVLAASKSIEEERFFAFVSGYEFVRQGFTMLEAEPALLSCQDGQFVGGKAVATSLAVGIRKHM